MADLCAEKAKPMPDTSLDAAHRIALFSGHMIDAPGREKPRFPPDKEPAAARAITRAVSDIDLGPGDIAICGGACGGDLLFAEAALPSGAHLELFVPFDETTFLERSVDFADHDWRARYFAVKGPPSSTSHPKNSVPSERRKTPTSATTDGCWNRRSASDLKRSSSSVCGMAREVTGQEEHVR
jgi:hypothetical protein